MSRSASIGGHVASAAIGALVGAIVVLGVEGATRGSEPSSPRPAPAPSSSQPDLPRASDRTHLLLAWSPGGIPRGAERAVDDVRGVLGATTVKAGLSWIASVAGEAGGFVEAIPRGMAIPFEVAVVDPSEYARFVPPSERDAVLGLRRGDIVLAETATELRSPAASTLTFTDGTRARVTGTLTDVATNGYEGVMRGPEPASWTRVDAYLLLEVRPGPARTRVAGTLRDLLPEGRALRVRAEGETPFLRYGDAVLPQLLLKETFGEFAAIPLPDGTISIESNWVKENIVTARVPILGAVRCHRVVVPQLRAALHETVDRGLSDTIDAGSYGGCFSARFINRDPDGRLSHHSWGIAIDLNVAENAPGTRPDQDERLVDVFEQMGFSWGGRWLIPDGMHFEWVRFPS